MRPRMTTRRWMLVLVIVALIMAVWLILFAVAVAYGWNVWSRRAGGIRA